MRLPRWLRFGQDTSYHCTSRTVGGQHLFSEADRGYFLHLLRRLARFCQVEVQGHNCLSTHFHVVVKIPGRVELDDQQLLEELKVFYGPDHHKTKAFSQARQDPNGALLTHLRTRYLARMGNLSVFIKELKDSFSKWYNAKYGRFGTLWAERFRSVLIGDDLNWLLNVIIYVDLNGVRANLYKRPEDDPFSSFAAAVARDGPARRALSKILPGETWEEKQHYYRQRLYSRGACPTKTGQAAIDPKLVYAAYKDGQSLSIGEALHLKIPAFTEGIAIGSQEFLDEISRQRKRRPTVGHPVPIAGWEGMLTLKKIKEPFLKPH